MYSLYLLRPINYSPIYYSTPVNQTFNLILFNFDTDPDPRIRFVETQIWIRIRPKIEKNTNFFLLITKKII